MTPRMVETLLRIASESNRWPRLKHLRDEALHHPHRCQGIERCSQSSCDQEEVEPPVNYQCGGRSASPSFDEANGCRKGAGPN